MARCPSCGKELPGEFPFCPFCAAPLTSTPDLREERKVVTVVFCDLVGSTARAERSDPEDVRELLSRYHGRVRAELERFGGTVEKFIGDAVVALFGAPVAHEDDPERAVRAALAVREWVGEEADLHVRIAVKRWTHPDPLPSSTGHAANADPGTRIVPAAPTRPIGPHRNPAWPSCVLATVTANGTPNLRSGA